MPTEFGRSIEISKRFYNVLWLGSTTNSFFKYDLATGNFKQYNYDTKNKIKWATWFHDLVYDVERTDNELQSANMMADFAASQSTDPDRIIPFKDDAARCKPEVLIQDFHLLKYFYSCLCI